jgi:hypothetical protein
MLTTIRNLIARAAVRIAIFAAPADKASQIRLATRPIWRPGENR